MIRGGYRVRKGWVILKTKLWSFVQWHRFICDVKLVVSILLLYNFYGYHFTMESSTQNNLGNYIYRGTKFNSRVETVKGERYLGTIPIRRFYIRCPKCVATITFKTDPENQVFRIHYRLVFTLHVKDSELH